MFDDDDDDDDELDMSDFERWFDDHVFYFPVTLRTGGYNSLSIEMFYRHVYTNIKKELIPVIRRLMGEQYPTILNEKRPAVLAEITRKVESIGWRLIFSLFELVYDEQMGVNLREKYPDFDEWVVFYGRRDTPSFMDPTFFDQFPWLSDEQKLVMIEEDRVESQEVFDWRDGRMQAFYDVVQPILFRYYKPLLELSADGWIIYAVWIREEYESYVFRFDYLETFIEYNFEEEDLDLPYDKFREKLRAKQQEEWTLRNIESSSTE